MMVLLLVSGRRYTDVLLRARRVRPLSEAAEAQWDLLPPLSYAGTNLAVSGILEPAYSIGGDSFDYAVNPGQLDMAIIDAIGHGLPAVLMASAAINTLRNARRERLTLEQAYRQTDRRIAEQFGHSYYVTGQIASLDTSNGRLSWLNAGHVLPLLVRNDSFVGELACRPSMPMGLGGPVVEIAVEQLQSGDRVLFHTDGVIESRSPDGTLFGARPARRLSGSSHPRPGLGRRDRSPALGQRRRATSAPAYATTQPCSSSNTATTNTTRPRQITVNPEPVSTPCMRCCTDCAARQRQRRCFDLRTYPSPNRRRRFAINFEPDDLAAVWIVIQPDTGSERPDQVQPATPHSGRIRNRSPRRDDLPKGVGGGRAVMHLDAHGWSLAHRDRHSGIGMKRAIGDELAGHQHNCRKIVDMTAQLPLHESPSDTRAAQLRRQPQGRGRGRGRGQTLAPLLHPRDIPFSRTA